MGDIGVSKDALRAVIPLTGEFVGTTDTQTLTTKTISTTDNTLTATSQAAGDILVNNATKFVRLARGAAGAPLKVNSGGTDIEYGTLTVAGGGTGATTLTGILKGAGTGNITAVTAPTGAILGDSDTQNITGAKTFSNTTIGARNPANTFTLTFSHPAIAAAMSRTWPHTWSAYTYTMHKEGALYLAQKWDGTILSSNSDLQVVLQAAIDACEADGGGDVYVPALPAANPWILPSAFTGFTIGNNSDTDIIKNVNVICALGAAFKVPNAFTGTFCTFTDGTHRNGWYGGKMYQSTPNWLWIGFEFIGKTNLGSCIFNTLERVRIDNAAIAIKLNNPATFSAGFVNGNYFHDCLAWSCDMGVLFAQGVTYSSGVNSMNRNVFNNFIFEVNSRATAFYGIKDIIGRDNMFFQCKIWDIVQTASYHASTVTANAEYTQIIGGIMTSPGWPADNLSSTTYVNEMFSPYTVGNTRKYENYEDVKAITIPGSAAAGYIRKYPKATDANNDGLYAKVKLNSAVEEVAYFP